MGFFFYQSDGLMIALLKQEIASWVCNFAHGPLNDYSIYHIKHTRPFIHICCMLPLGKIFKDCVQYY